MSARAVLVVTSLLLAPAAGLAQQGARIDGSTGLPLGSTDTRPGGRTFGLGLSVGAPTGLVGKYHLAPGSGLQFGVGGAGHGYLSVHVDYVFSFADIAASPDGKLYAYGGFGLGVGLFGSYHPVFFNPYFVNPFLAAVDVHLTGGVAWNFRMYPIDLFLEVSPGLLIVPGIGFGWHGNLGFRYWF